MQIIINVMFLLVLVMQTSWAMDVKAPESLEKWKDWVLYDKKHINCYQNYQNENIRHCVWYDQLKLFKNNENKSIEFSQNVTVHGKTKVFLLGDHNLWPNQVDVNNKRASVLETKGKPYILLDKGKYKITGAYEWDDRLPYITLNKATLLVEFYLKDRGIYHLQEPPFIDVNNKLWFKQKKISQAKQNKKINNSFDMEVYRNFSDGIPLLVNSFYRIKVSGHSREINIKDVIPPDFSYHAYSSNLPIQLNNDHSATLQIKPGTWEFNIVARSSSEKAIGEIKYFSKDKNNLSKQEIWTFKENLALQQVDVISSQRIDSSQTLIPKQWRKNASFLMQAGTSLKIIVKKRGNATPSSNNLTLNKKIWLDFSGKGLTVQDNIKGVMNRNWRLNLLPDISPGKVTLNNNPQLITKSKDNKTGVEVNNGNINLLAESRIEGNIKKISTVGWDNNFKKVEGSLYLPAGWSVFHISGVDRISKGWIEKWTLLDLFQVLLFSIIIYKLWGKHWGIISLIFFTLLAHKANAPIWVWLSILISISLLKILSKGKLKQFIRWYKNASVIVLLIIIVPFWITEVRTGIYPQLKHSSYDTDRGNQYSKSNFSSRGLDSQVLLSGNQLDAEKADFADDSSYQRSKKVAKAYILKEKKISNTARYDANAKVQTGPGLPAWSFNHIRLYWTGPVSKEQTMEFHLISPLQNLLLTIVMVLLSVLLLTKVLEVDLKLLSSKLMKIIKESKKATSTLAVLILLVMAQSESSLAQGLDKSLTIPSIELLKEYERRLTKQDECVPDCLSVEKMFVDIDSNEIFINIIVNSGTKTILPLPFKLDDIILKNVLVNNLNNDQFIKYDNEALVPLEKGQYELLINGKIRSNSIVMPLSVPIHNVSYNLKDWNINGLKNKQPISNELILQKNILKMEKEVVQEKSFANNNIPVFAKITRNFHFDLDWTITTTVTRLSDKNPSHSSAVMFEYPLMKGESVISYNKKINNNKIQINLNSNQNSFSWKSKLDKSDKILLQTINNKYWIEQWQINTSPIWHIEHHGIAPIQHINSSRSYTPIWRPWNNESVELTITRPAAIKGNTTTITKSTRISDYGNKMSEHKIHLNYNSSQGGRQTIELPENITVLSLKVANKSLAIDEKNNKLEFSLPSGKNEVEINWRESESTQFKITGSEVKLSIPSVNSHQKVKLPRDRWIVYLAGPDMGPVVLFWGMLFVLLIVAYSISKIPNVPLTASQALLLSIGLAPVDIFALIFVLAWFVVISQRDKILNKSTFNFNFAQIILAGMTVVTVLLFIYTIESGLLGTPKMHISGNDSSAYLLNWYQDRTTEVLPQASIFSLNIYWYRILMLVWALWLALAVTNWAKWFWENYTLGGYWKKIVWKRKKIVKNVDATNKIKD